MKNSEKSIQLDMSRLQGFKQLDKVCTPETAGQQLSKIGEVPPSKQTN